MHSKTIGIDLGTTFSAVASVDDSGRAVVLKNGNEETLTPSVVWFNEEGVIVGSEAKEMQAMGEDNIASFFKRNMGDPNFSLHFHGINYSAQDISAVLLKKLKEDAEAALGTSVEKAVITVPAYFNNLQREATISAGQEAGLEVLRIINEPTAAAIAFGISRPANEQTVLVYDLGGGTFDVTIMKTAAEEIIVLGTDGDHELGGKNWDDRIVNWVAQKFEEEFGIDPLSDSLSFNEILVRAENAKKQLSTRDSTRIIITHEGEKGRYDLNRSTFEEITTDLLERTQMLVDRLLEDIQLSWKDIDGVLLVGGSTRMPMVSNWILGITGEVPMRGINVDEAVALGAAIQANLDANPPKDTELLSLASAPKIRDVMSHSLGLVAENEDRSKYINSIIIPKNNPIPSEHTRPYQLFTRPGDGNELEVLMLQGENKRPLDCQIIGRYIFSNIQHQEGKSVVLDVSYAYDSNGVIKVQAKQRSTGKDLNLRIESIPDELSWLDEAPTERDSQPAHLSVLIAIDLSGSMSGEPLRKSQEAARDFIQQLDLSNSSVGLMIFSDRVKLSQDLCQDAKALSKGVNSWTIGSVGYGNAAQPFTKALDILKEREDPRYLIVLTDGIWSSQSHAIAEAEKCKSAEIEIIAIGFSGADQEFLRKIATSDANALYTNLGGLTTSFSKIAQVLTESGNTGNNQGGGKLRIFS